MEVAKLLSGFGTNEREDRLVAIAATLRHGEHPTRPFHWELEFPEVFSRDNPGFDTIVGNPPFLGGKRISGEFGGSYRDWLSTIHWKSHGNADLVAYFFRRAFDLLRSSGALGLIATNTIGQGDTRTSGLTQILSSGGMVTRAVRRLKWPGEAAVVVSVIHIIKGLAPFPILDGRRVRRISAYLVEGELDESPVRLAANANSAFQGSIVLGMGFTFDDEASLKGEAESLRTMKALVDGDARNREVIHPYIGGDALNTDPRQTTRRFIIDLKDMSQSEARARYPDLMNILETRVRPERQRQKREDLRKRWWQFAYRKNLLYTKAGHLRRVMARSLTSAHFSSFVFLSSEFIFDQTIIVWPTEATFLMSILCSRAHELWATFLGADIGGTGRYNIVDCFETFPLPSGADVNHTLKEAGQTYTDHRAEVMVTRNEGMTKTYRRLVIPVSIQPGEGLPELVFRAASENSYPTTSAVLLAAGMHGLYPAGIGSRALGHEAALASTLGLKEGHDALCDLAYRPIASKPGWHTFFGTEIRLTHREVRRRRISPLALRKSNHARAIWSVKIFSFDPETKETLLDKCPVCGSYLGFEASYGVSFCGKCLGEDEDGFIRGQVDLRDFPQPQVEVEDVEALDFVTGLIDPDPVVRTNFRPNLPDTLQSYSRGALFEFAVVLACAVTADPKKPSGFVPRTKSRKEYSRFTPEILSLVGRTILEWPQGFERLTSLARESAELRKGHYGIAKELGALLGLRFDPYIEPGLCEEARIAIEDDMRRTATGHGTVRRRENLYREDLMTMEQASKQLGTTRKMMRRLVDDGTITAQRAGTAAKAPVLVSRQEIETALNAINRYIWAASISNRTGLPIVVLESLSAVGILEKNGMKGGLGPAPFYSKESVENFLQQFVSCAQSVSRSINPICLRRVSFMAGSPVKNPWPGIVKCALKGEIKLYCTKSNESLVGKYFFDEADVASVADLAQPWLEKDLDMPLKRADVGLLLDLPSPSVYDLMRGDLISKQPTLREVQEFHRLYVMSSEAARFLRGENCMVDWDVSGTMSSSGLEPAFTTSMHKRRIWHRSEVIQLARTSRMQ